MGTITVRRPIGAHPEPRPRYPFATTGGLLARLGRMEAQPASVACRPAGKRSNTGPMPAHYTGPMNWNLLVPGALPPASLAPALVAAMPDSHLAQMLGTARRGPPFEADERAAGAVHWSWLGRAFGVAGDPPVTAPYAWRGADAAPEDAHDGKVDGAHGGVAAAAWIAHCDPIHMAVSRDHLLVTDLGAAPLTPDEDEALFAAADALVRGQPGVRLARRGGAWFLIADAPWNLHMHPLAAVLGRPAQDRMPSGADARRWRTLSNEIQMTWHASAVNEAREERDLRSANALWLHGGGTWAPLPAAHVADIRVDAADPEAATLRGWLGAARAARAAPLAPACIVSLHGGLAGPYAHQAWESWLEALPALEARIQSDLAAAADHGATQFALVLCGHRRAHVALLPLGAPRRGLAAWLPGLPGRLMGRGSGARHDGARLLQQWLGEAEPAGAAREAQR